MLDGNNKALRFRDDARRIPRALCEFMMEDECLACMKKIGWLLEKRIIILRVGRLNIEGEGNQLVWTSVRRW